MRPMPMVGPAGMVMMTPPLGERPPMAPGATPMGKGVPTRVQDVREKGDKVLCL
jgi:hypothetical protein